MGSARGSSSRSARAWTRPGGRRQLRYTLSGSPGRKKTVERQEKSARGRPSRQALSEHARQQLGARDAHRRCQAARKISRRIEPSPQKCGPEAARTVLVDAYRVVNTPLFTFRSRQKLRHVGRKLKKVVSSAGACNDRYSICGDFRAARRWLCRSDPRGRAHDLASAGGGAVSANVPARTRRAVSANAGAAARVTKLVARTTQERLAQATDVAQYRALHRIVLPSAAPDYANVRSN